jgi:hypothetical protein
MLHLLFPHYFLSLFCSHEQIFTTASTNRQAEPHWWWLEGGGGGAEDPHPNNFLSDKELASKLLVSDLASNFLFLFYLLFKKD